MTWGSRWTQAKDDRLMGLIRDGLTMTLIAAKMGMTRSQIAGRARRVRIMLSDDSLHFGLSAGRTYVRPGEGDPNGKHARRKALARARWEKWAEKTGHMPKVNKDSRAGAIMAAIKIATGRNKRDRKREANLMMRHRICCCANPVDLFARTGCCWPLWGNDDPPFSEKLYCNNVNEQGNKYCSAHARLMTEYVAGAFALKPNARKDKPSFWINGAAVQHRKGPVRRAA